MKKTITISSNTAWFLFNFRGGLIKALDVAGYRVIALVPPDGYKSRLESLGCQVVDFPMDNKGTNPVRDGILILNYRREYSRLKPVASLHFTIKPVIYGSLAAQTMKIPCVNMITGLGTAFMRDNWLTRLVEILYRLSQKKAKRIFFLNNDDWEIFLESNLSPLNCMERLQGEGVDLVHFAPTEPPGEGELRFLLIGRMLWDKGVGEFVEAARNVSVMFPNVRFQLLGPVGVDNQTAIAREMIESWEKEGVIEYMGETDDVRPYISQAHCIVLPSYREGSPRTLLEGAAMKRPIIATDAVGCRNIVDDGVNGFLCRIKDAEDLAEKIVRFIQLPRAVQCAMGQAGRAKMEREFDECVIIERYLELIDGIRSCKSS